MYDEDSRPWAPGQGWDRTYTALTGGGLNMAREAFVEAKRLSTMVPIPLVAPNVASFNPSVAFDGDGRLVVAIRTTGTVKTVGAIPPTTNYLGEIRDGALVDLRKVTDCAVPGIEKLIYGIEDTRIFRLGGRLCAVATITCPIDIGFAKATMCLFDVAVDRVGGVNFTNPRPFESPRYERNWSPCVDGDRLRLVYSIEPLYVFDCDVAAGRVSPGPGVIPKEKLGGTMRGGSQLVPYKGGWLAVVHGVSGAHPRIEYTHRFAVYSSDLTSVKVGKPFFFQKRGIEFCAGLAVDPSDGHFWVSYGVEDKVAFAAKVRPETVEEFL